MIVHPSKWVIVPVSGYKEDCLRKFLIKSVTEWADFKIAQCEKYLGIYLGPGATAEMNWSKPVATACALFVVNG